VLAAKARKRYVYLQLDGGSVLRLKKKNTKSASILSGSVVRAGGPLMALGEEVDFHLMGLGRAARFVLCSGQRVCFRCFVCVVFRAVTTSLRNMLMTLFGQRSAGLVCPARMRAAT